MYINDIKHAIGCDTIKIFAHQLSINSEKINFVHFQAKNKPIPEQFDCIQTTFLAINRVKCVQYLG